MLCPICQETLQMTDRQGVEIDYCPKCRGVWLDRGELQKLIDLSLTQVESNSNRGNVAADIAPLDYPPRHKAPDYEEHPDARRRDDRRYDDRRYDEPRYEERRYDSYSGYGKPKKRESWFSELFDFD